MLDYHVHLWPHAERAESADYRLERLARYCERAQAGGGHRDRAFTEHLFRFRAGRATVGPFWVNGPDPAPAQQIERYSLRPSCGLPISDAYVQAVLDARAAGLPIILGLEVDYYVGQMDVVAALLAGYPFDVLLGSVHWIDNWMFDNLDDEVAMAEWDRRGTEQAWRSLHRRTRGVGRHAHLRRAGPSRSREGDGATSGQGAARRVPGPNGRGGGASRDGGGALLGGLAQARGRALSGCQPARAVLRTRRTAHDGERQPRQRQRR